MKNLSIISQCNAIIAHCRRNNIVLDCVTPSKDNKTVYGYIHKESAYVTVWCFIDNDYLDNLAGNLNNRDNIADSRY